MCVFVSLFPFPSLCVCECDSIYLFVAYVYIECDTEIIPNQLAVQPPKWKFVSCLLKHSYFSVLGKQRAFYTKTRFNLYRVFPSHRPFCFGFFIRCVVFTISYFILCLVSLIPNLSRCNRKGRKQIQCHHPHSDYYDYYSIV